MKRFSLLLLLASFATGYAAQVGGGRNVEELRRQFQNPPDDSRIMMRWWWFGPAVTTPQLERDMRHMKEGGIGGFEVQPVYPLELDNEATGLKNLPFLSDEFLSALRFTAGKARELGLRFDLTLGSGWPYGGATVPVSQASARLRVERVAVSGSSVPLPRLNAGETLIAAFGTDPQGGAREITDIRNSAVSLPADSGATSVQFFISSRTGMQVKRPAVGAEGPVVNHLDRAALDSYLSSVGDRLLKAVEPNRPYAIFADSLEVYNADWTDNFLSEFQTRRGYDLKPHLVALTSGTDRAAENLRHDWGKTLTELLNENFLAPLEAWSRRNGTLLRAQAYGTPAAALSSNAFVDLSEGEGLQWDRLTATRWASSANHIYGRPVTSSETFTWLNSPPFAATPLDMKAEADRHFLQGINQIIGHGWPYSPDSARYPGWHFYAAGAFNDKNPWWIVMPDVTRYLQRISFMMRQGQPANDVAIYLPNDDAWSSFRTGTVSLIDSLRQRVGTNLIPALLAAGYNFDFFDDDAFQKNGRVENGTLRLGPNAYKIVILPNVEQMPSETLESFEEFAHAGGILVATRRMPAKSPGYRATPQDDDKLKSVANRLFQGQSPAGIFVADEAVQLGQVLKSKVQPDVAFSTAAPDIGFVHRRVEGADIYFLANTSNVPIRVNSTFRMSNRTAEWWDPHTGNVSTADIAGRTASGLSVSVDLEAYGSRVLVFPNRPGTARPRNNAAAAPQTVDLRKDWRVSFGAGGLSRQVNLPYSWMDDEATRYFSGVAVFEKNIEVPDRLLRNGMSVLLDFGQTRPDAVQAAGTQSANGMRTALVAPVRDAAVVYVNGRRAGSVWHPPYALDVTAFLKAGQNQLRIEVANTALNDMAGHPLPDYRLLNQRYGERFQVQDLQRVRALPSGLLGDLRLIATAATR